MAGVYCRARLPKSQSMNRRGILPWENIPFPPPMTGRPSNTSQLLNVLPTHNSVLGRKSSCNTIGLLIQTIIGPNIADKILKGHQHLEIDQR